MAARCGAARAVAAIQPGGSWVGRLGFGSVVRLSPFGGCCLSFWVAGVRHPCPSPRGCVGSWSATAGSDCAGFKSRLLQLSGCELRTIIVAKGTLSR